MFKASVSKRYLSVNFENTNFESRLVRHLGLCDLLSLGLNQHRETTCNADDSFSGRCAKTIDQKHYLQKNINKLAKHLPPVNPVHSL